MSEEWQLPVPREDPEARKESAVSDGGGCPRIVPDGNFIEGEMEDGRQDSPHDAGGPA